MRVSEHYKLGMEQPSLPFVDVDIENDIKLFINPRAIANLKSDWGIHCHDLIRDFFSELLQAVHTKNEAHALYLLNNLKEPNESHLGLSKGTSDGRGLGPKKAKEIWQSFKSSKAATSGLLTDLEDTVLLIEGISTDILSDIATNIIRGALITFTQKMCREYSIRMDAEVQSGPVWNMNKKKWDNEFVELPVPNGHKLLLVPKSIVRLDMDYNVGQYYRHYILESLREEEIQKNSDLVRIVQSGRNKGNPKVYKTDLAAKYGTQEKTVSIEQTNRNPDILQQYKADHSNPTPALSHMQIATMADSDLPDWNKLLTDVASLPVGKRDAYLYEDAILSLLYALFYPVLVDPESQTELHNGLKKVDITFTNNALTGFFNWVSHHYPAPYIFVECKNYGSEIGNPEIDQIAMRLSTKRGMLGFVMCRSVDNPKRMLARCKAIAQDDGKYIIVLDDNDLTALVTEIANNALLQQHDLPLLRKKFKQLTM